MSTLVKTRRKNQIRNSKFRSAYVTTTALAKVVKFDEELMHVHLTDGRIISAPIYWVSVIARSHADPKKAL